MRRTSKMKFEKPIIEIDMFNSEDIVTTSIPTTGAGQSANTYVNGQIASMDNKEQAVKLVIAF